MIKMYSFSSSVLSTDIVTYDCHPFVRQLISKFLELIIYIFIFILAKLESSTQRPPKQYYANILIIKKKNSCLYYVNLHSLYFIKPFLYLSNIFTYLLRCT